MITHEEVLNALCKEFTTQIQTLIINYVIQQEKVSKLLELYKDQVQYAKRYAREGCYFDYEDIEKLDEQIKELENEIK